MAAQLISALLGAALGALSSFFVYRRTAVFQNANDFREAMVNVCELREHQITFVNAQPDPGLRAALGQLTNSKREMYLGVARSLAGSIARQLTSADYCAIGFEFQTDGEYALAEGYFHSGLRAAERARPIDTNGAVVALRYLGQLRMMLNDPSGSDTQYQKAVDLTEKQDNPAHCRASGETYQYWGTVMASAGRAGWRDKFASATESFSRMPIGPDRSQAEEGLAMVQHMIEAGNPPPPTPVDLHKS